ncbi:MAG: DUF3137 domain-containing protein [Campylobacter sp.]|nr:DUF3137 domain-containing protein [Campylobacter sp.]
MKLDLTSLEVERRRVQKKLNSYSLPLKLGFIGLFVLLAVAFKGRVEYAAFSLAVCAIGYITLSDFVKNRVSKDLVYRFKNEVLSNIVSSVNLSYTWDAYMPYTEFVLSGIYGNYFDIYKGNDLISGVVNGVKIRFSDILVEIKKDDNMSFFRSGSMGAAMGILKAANNNQAIRIFQGIFFVAKFNKNIKYATYVIDRASRSKFVGKSRAYMDNSKFEKTFITYTYDQVNARYILTPRLMEDILKLRAKFDCPIDICFMGNSVYFYIAKGCDSFEIDINLPLVGKNSAIEFYKNEILSVIELIDDLRLSDDLWK